MKYSIVGIIGIIICTLFACASDQSTTQKTTFANYYIRYVEPENKIKAEATFLAGDSINNATPIEISDGVVFQDHEMIFQDLKTRGIRYQVQKNRPYSKEYRFKYKDNNGVDQVYLTSMTPITNYSVKDKISKTKGLTLNWEGDPLKQNEHLVFLFDTPDNKALMTDIEGPTTSSEVTIPASKFAGVSLGKGKIYLVKKQIKTLKQEHIVTTSTLEYYTSTIDVEVVE